MRIDYEVTGRFTTAWTCSSSGSGFVREDARAPPGAELDRLAGRVGTIVSADNHHRRGAAGQGLLERRRRHCDRVGVRGLATASPCDVLRHIVINQGRQDDRPFTVGVR
jgi:hypothetical protein